MIKIIWAIVGDCGSGKTLLAVFLAYQDYLAKQKIFANLKLNFTFEPLTDKFFRNYKDFPVFNATVIFDEFSLFFSARASMSKQNMLLKNFIIQTRKRSLKLIYCTQQLKLVDVNCRNNTDKIYLPYMRVKRGPECPYIRKPEDWVHKKGDTYILFYDIYDKDMRLLRRCAIPEAEKFFNLYNSYEIIDFNTEPEKKNKEV